MIFVQPAGWSEAPPQFVEWCKFYGYDPHDDTWWEVYAEWRTETYGHWDRG